MIRITDPEWEAEARKAVEAVIRLYEKQADYGRDYDLCPCCSLSGQVGLDGDDCCRCPIHLYGSNGKNKRQCTMQKTYIKKARHYSDLTPAQRTARIAHLRKVKAAIPELKRRYGAKP